MYPCSYLFTEFTKCFPYAMFHKHQEPPVCSFLCLCLLYSTTIDEFKFIYCWQFLKICISQHMGQTSSLTNNFPLCVFIENEIYQPVNSASLFIFLSVVSISMEPRYLVKDKMSSIYIHYYIYKHMYKNIYTYISVPKDV